MVIVLINYLLFHFSLIRALKQGNISNTCNNLTKMSSSSSTVDIFDHEYPGTSVIRMNNVRHRVRSLTPEDLNGDWINVRRKLLWAGGLKDLEDAAPGQGYTGHSFNDFNHCDLTTMLEDYRDFTNDGKVAQIHYKNALGAGIRIASIEELGPGGSWTTCMIGCNSEPPRDVAHLQFHSRIAFKLVWCPPLYRTFVLVDDSGNYLNKGTPTGDLPGKAERMHNFRLVVRSKFSTDALRVGAEEAEAASSTTSAA